MYNKIEIAQTALPLTLTMGPLRFPQLSLGASCHRLCPLPAAPLPPALTLSWRFKTTPDTRDHIRQTEIHPGPYHPFLFHTHPPLLPCKAVTACAGSLPCVDFNCVTLGVCFWTLLSQPLPSSLCLKESVYSQVSATDSLDKQLSDCFHWYETKSAALFFFF